MNQFRENFMATRALGVFVLASVAAMPLIAQQGGAAGARSEMTALAATAAKESGRPAYTPATGVQFKSSDNVFLKSALAVDFTYRKATVTLPLYRGRSPGGEDVYYIITEASDFEVAKQMGINYSPKMAKAAGTPGAQAVTLSGGVMRFKSNVDFAPEYQVTPGRGPHLLSAQVVQAGATGDAEWSSMAVLPSGVVLNVQMHVRRSCDVRRQRRARTHFR